MSSITDLSTSRVDRSRALEVVGKFTIATVAGVLIYVGLYISLSATFNDLGPAGMPTKSTLTDLARWLFWMISPAPIAAFVYLHLPEESVDKYHKLGKLFVLLVSINLVLSGMFIAYNTLYQPLFHETVNPVVSAIIMFSLASVGLPGPYLGALIATRWIR